MAMQKFEIYFKHQNVTTKDWANFVSNVSKYHSLLDSWRIMVRQDNNKIRYFVETNLCLSATIDKSGLFLLRKISNIGYDYINYDLAVPCFSYFNDGLMGVMNWISVKKREKFLMLEISFFNFGTHFNRTKACVYSSSGFNIYKRNLVCADPISLLAFDFANNYYSYKNLSKSLKAGDNAEVLKTSSNNPIFIIKSLLYDERQYIDETGFDFDKHSIILGSSGSGKSKLISLIARSLHQNINIKPNYKIIVVDPHANMENDLKNFSKIVDFNHESANLFNNNVDLLIANTDTLLDLFKSFLSDRYNSKLERILRFSIYLLLKNSSFSFSNLRKLLTDLEFRDSTIEQMKFDLPTNIIAFFRTDFNDLKASSYEVAILPIINFIDEIDIAGVFDNCDESDSLETLIGQNFITLFSLDQTRLGTNVVKTISGLVMQQVFEIAKRRAFDEHIIMIIDEISVVENPILIKMLAEVRKYNVSIMLVGQYFNQISYTLRDAIFSNVSNYFIFRISQVDATLLLNNIDINLISDSSLEKKIKLLSSLDNRTCIARVSKGNKLFPALMATTANYNAKELGD